ncbi:MAG: regulatory protein RecX [Actinomycetes bacterium]
MPRRSPAHQLDPADGPTPGSSASAGPDADPVEVARAVVLRQLTNGPRTRAQLAEALRRRSVPDEAAQQVLDRFGELGYVDDDAFAHAWVESRHNGRGLARRALAHELRQRGVADETARAALEAVDAESERATAQRLARRRLASMRTLPRDVVTRRLVAMLARKGYPPSVAGSVVRELLGEDVDGVMGVDVGD